MNISNPILLLIVLLQFYLTTATPVQHGHIDVCTCHNTGIWCGYRAVKNEDTTLTGECTNTTLWNVSTIYSSLCFKNCPLLLRVEWCKGKRLWLERDADIGCEIVPAESA
jgi:hypothetical protein